MKNISTDLRTLLAPSKSGISIALLALALAGFGCEDSKVVGQTTGKNNGTQTQRDVGGTGEVDDAGHGHDEDVTLIAPGFVNGSWRVGAAEDQSLIVNLDLIQEDGATEVEGYYTMSMLAENGAADKGGDIMSSSTFDGTTLTVQWNPTQNENEIYTIEATKQDENNFTGTLSALVFTDVNQEIRISRYPGSPSTDGEGEETAGDIDAGQQGGAGG
ncbi:hypothetical protein [Bradymonas sediminis]|nr:hypothetical protein [Bradymonas sediminis]TDP62647.1 hypothetical protein DFR33_11252 [Bradymonas sediminis]